MHSSKLEARSFNQSYTTGSARKMNTISDNLMTAMSALAVCALILFSSMPSVVNAAPERIISTDAGTTEILVALGKGESLVGIDVTSRVPEGLNPAKVGYHRNLAAEGLLSLAPDILFGSQHIGPEVTLNALKSADVTLVVQPVAKDSDQLIRNVKMVADSVGVSGQSLIDQVNVASGKIQTTQEQRAELNAVFLLYMEGRGLKQAGTGTTGDALIKLLGMKNASDHQNYRSVSAEGLLAMQPDVVLIGTQNPEAAEALMKQHASLQYTPAAKNKRILTVDASALVAGISLKAMEEAVRLADSL